ncbi:MAG: FN3 domain-containing metallophosphoesterase family protein [Bacteroidota bacterium]
MDITRSQLVLTCILLFLSTSLFGRTDKYRCMWRDDPATTMVIGWNQLSGQKPVLYYGTQDGGTLWQAYSHQQSPSRYVPSKGMHNYFVRLSNLQPATTYYFIIVDSEGPSRRLSFRTAPSDPSERLSIIAGGDSRNYRASRRKANQLVGKLKPHLVMFGGDMTGGDNATQWRGWFDDWQHTITSEGRMTPIVVTRGNHEYSNQTLIDLFDAKEAGLYYGLTIGGDLLRIYTLNSLIACGGKQRDWLEDDLANHGHIQWKLAQYHFAIRPHTRKKRERNDQLLHWAPLFETYQMNMVVESDAHCVKTTYPIRPSRGSGSDEGFIRDDRRGTVFVGEGCWGAPLRRNDDDKSWTRNSGSFNQFKWFFVDQEKIELRTVMTDNAEEVGEVSLNNPFAIPTNLAIWEPSNGPVIHIWPMQSEEEHPLLASNSRVPILSYAKERDLKLLEFVAEVTKEGVVLAWETSQEPTHNNDFALQRSVAGLPFQTIAQVAGQGNAKNVYKIVDTGGPTDGNKPILYRLVGRSTRGNSQVYGVSQLQQSAELWKDYQELSSDPQTGMLKVIYALNDCADVRIRLMNRWNEVVSHSEYKDQSPGNFLKSINMKRLQNGRYLLIIQAGDRVIYQYRIEHGV